MFKKVMVTFGAMSLAVAPTVASANPAQSLSVASSVRASAASDERSELAGAGWIPVAVLAVVAIVGIVLLSNDDDDPDSP